MGSESVRAGKLLLFSPTTLSPPPQSHARSASSEKRVRRAQRAAQSLHTHTHNRSRARGLSEVNSWRQRAADEAEERSVRER